MPSISTEKRSRHPLQPSLDRRGSHVARFEAIRPYVTGKSVLDIGAAYGLHEPDWLHGLIAQVAARTVAVENNHEFVADMRTAGHEAVFGDAQDMNLGQTFDVVFAGELIEHLVDFKGFFDSIRRHLEPSGIVVLTTPNAFGFTNFIYRLGRKPAPINPYHTCWFCEDTMRTMLKRCDFETDSIGYIRHETPGRLRSKLSLVARTRLPERLAWRTLVVVARPELII